MRHIFINHLNASAGLHHRELVLPQVFFLCLVHNCINHFRNIFIREDQGEVITSAGLKQFRVGEHSTPR